MAKNNLNNILKEKGITQAEIVRRTGLNKGQMSLLVNGRDVMMSTARKVCIALSDILEREVTYNEVFGTVNTFAQP